MYVCGLALSHEPMLALFIEIPDVVQFVRNTSICPFCCFIAFDIGTFKFGGLLLQLLLRPAHFICLLGVLQWTRTLSINSTHTGRIDC